MAMITLKISPRDSARLKTTFSRVKVNPYLDYQTFDAEVGALNVPYFWQEMCTEARERREGGTDVVLIQGLPITEQLFDYSHSNALTVKKQQTDPFVSEVILQSHGLLADLPAMGYSSRSEGSRFQLVYPEREYSDTQTPKTDGSLHWHNDRTAHLVPPSHLTLLAVHVPENSGVRTQVKPLHFILPQLDQEVIELLKAAAYRTPYDRFSRDSNPDQKVSPLQPILKDGRVLYYHGRTFCDQDPNSEISRALEQFRSAVDNSRSEIIELQTGDLCSFENLGALHFRNCTRGQQPDRRILKQYSLTHQKMKQAQGFFVDGQPGLIDDKRIADAQAAFDLA